jgi:hypothetical protein
MIPGGAIHQSKTGAHRAASATRSRRLDLPRVARSIETLLLPDGSDIPLSARRR